MYIPIRNVPETFVLNTIFVTELVDLIIQSGPVWSCGRRRQSGPVWSCDRQRKTPAGSIDKFNDCQTTGFKSKDFWTVFKNNGLIVRGTHRYLRPLWANRRVRQPECGDPHY